MIRKHWSKQRQQSDDSDGFNGDVTKDIDENGLVVNQIETSCCDKRLTVAFHQSNRVLFGKWCIILEELIARLFSTLHKKNRVTFTKLKGNEKHEQKTCEKEMESKI